MKEFLFWTLVVALLLGIVLGSIRQFYQWTTTACPNVTCPSCGSTEEVVPIIYGLPAPELVEEARQGRVVLGGCMMSADSPGWHCHRCGTRWGRAE